MKHSFLATVFILTSSSLSVVRGQTYERIDVNDQGAPGVPASGGGAMSDDARFVVFLSNATNLGGIDVPGAPDLFLRDRSLGTTVRVPMGTGTDGITGLKISGDGQRIFFTRGGFSAQSPTQQYVYDRPSNVLREIVLPGLAFVKLGNINFDGRFAAVTARNGWTDSDIAYRLDVDADALLVCSVDIGGNWVGGLAVDIDDDGTHLLIESTAQMVAGDTNGFTDAYLYDIPGNIYLRVAEAQGGAQPSNAVFAHSLSGNGRYVSFATVSTNLDASPVGAAASRVYVRDVRLETTELASTFAPGEPSSPLAGASRVSLDGSNVAYQILNFPGLSTDVFFRDIASGTSSRVSSASDDLGFASLAGLSSDGRNVLFSSNEQGVPGQTTIGGIFLAKFGPRCSTSGYCTSLPNSTGAAATIGAQGDASRTLNNLVIAGVGMPDTANALLVSGTTAVDPGTPFGNGLMCIGGALIRHGIHVANGGVILDHQDMNSPEYAGVNPGDTRHYQIFYRDPAAGGANFNTTDAVSVTFCW